MKIPKTKIVMNFETLEEFQKQLERVKNYKLSLEEVPNGQELKNIDINLEKDKTTIKADETKIVQTSSGFILITNGELKTTNGIADGWNKKETNHTLENLRQKLINNLYNATYYDKNDIEILKILFENNDI